MSRGGITRLAASPDGGALFVAGRDGVIRRCIIAAASEPDLMLEGHAMAVSGLAASPGWAGGA
jgi:hypothetical protein